MESGLAAGLPRAIGEAGAKVEEEPSRFAAWARTASVSFFGVALRGLGGHRDQTLRWLNSTVAFAAGLAFFGAVGSILLQVVVVVWNAAAYWGSHGQLPPSGLRLSEDATLVCLGIPILLFGAVVFTSSLVAWPEIVGPRSPSRPQYGLRVLFQVRQSGLLAPVEARRVWRERLVSLLFMSALMMIAGVVSHLAAAGFSTVFGTGGLAGVRPYTYWGFAAALLFSLWSFALLPALPLAYKTIALSGCLLFVLIYVGLFGVMLVDPLLWGLGLIEHPLAEPPVGLLIIVAVAWTGLLLAMSWAWCEPSTWRLEPDGARSAANVLKALAVLLALMFSAGLLTRLLMVLMTGVE